MLGVHWARGQSATPGTDGSPNAWNTDARGTRTDQVNHAENQETP